MTNQTVLLILAVATVAAFGVLMSSAANAEQLVTGSPFSILSTYAAGPPVGFVLTGGGHGGGGHHKDGHHGGHHWKHNWGHRWPYYWYGNSYSCWKCWWQGHKKVCYNYCDEWY